MLSKKVIIGLILTGIAATISAQELSAKSYTSTVGDAKISYHPGFMTSILRVEYKSGTKELYFDFSNDSTVDYITITNRRGEIVPYNRINPEDQPIIKLGQIIFDDYMSKIKKN